MRRSLRDKADAILKAGISSAYMTALLRSDKINRVDAAFINKYYEYTIERQEDYE